MTANTLSHIAIIMDGNGRWAKKRGLPRLVGHREGGKAADKAIRNCLDIGVQHLTLFAFSRENWQRPQSEVDGLMKLLVKYLHKEGIKQQQLNTALNVIGDIAGLPEPVQSAIVEAKKLRPDTPDLTVHLAINYSGQWDMLQAAQRTADAKLPITAEHLERHLITANIPEPDLLIRTGGEMRISNFLLWQLAYTELYFTDTLWPDFDRQNLEMSLQTFGHRERRFGLISEQLATATG